MKRAVLIAVMMVAVIGSAAILWRRGGVEARRASAVALEGIVSSEAEGRMEGVLVSAKRIGSSIAITVVSDAQGRYSFPKDRLQPGKSRISIRAVGYDLEDPGEVVIPANNTVQVNLKLQPTKDLASQLTNAEWLMSFPGTPEQKKRVAFCVRCHTLQLLAESSHDAKAWLDVLYRMSTYSPTSGARIVPPIKSIWEIPRNDAAQKPMAEYLSTVNLSAVTKWEYSLKTLPRPKGRATKAIFTVYDLPREEENQPHDAPVDPNGMVWYTDFTRPYIGMLNPQTGEVKEYKLPEVKPEYPPGSNDMEFDEDGNPWISMMAQAAIAKFDRRTEKFQVWSIPKEYNNRSRQGMLAVPRKGISDRRIWFADSANLLLHRLDPVSGKIDTFPPYRDLISARTPHSIYGIAVDSQGNCWFADMSGNNMGKVDAKTGKVTLYPILGPDAGPRRFFIDPQDRLWFAEDRGSDLGMLDSKTGQFRKWPIPTLSSNNLLHTYDTVVDKNGEVWVGGMMTDQVYRFDPKTEEFTEYLLPIPANIRRVDVDNSTTPVTFWTGANHAAKLVKLELLD